MENEEQAVEASESGTLSDFTNLNQESYTVTVSNQGANSFAYTITPSEDWIVVSKKSGTVKSQDAFEVSVDFSKVKKDASGSVKTVSYTHLVVGARMLYQCQPDVHLLEQYFTFVSDKLLH